MKKANKINKVFCEDLEFAKRTEKALKRHEKCGFIEISKEDFIKEIEKW